MLKIKDNVDLKELENFGFTFRKHYNNWTYLCSENDYEDYVDNYIQIGEDKILQSYIRILNGHDTEYIDKSQAIIKDEFLDKIYDLIQADLVEKVSIK